jgi:hypothetical protein
MRTRGQLRAPGFSRRIHRTGNREMNEPRAQRADRAGDRTMGWLLRRTHHLGDQEVSRSHRDPLVTQVTAWRGNASTRATESKWSASSMGIRAVRSAAPSGQPRGDEGFAKRISAVGRARLLG